MLLLSTCYQASSGKKRKPTSSTPRTLLWLSSKNSSSSTDQQRTLKRFGWRTSKGGPRSKKASNPKTPITIVRLTPITLKIAIITRGHKKLNSAAPNMLSWQVTTLASKRCSDFTPIQQHHIPTTSIGNGCLNKAISFCPIRAISSSTTSSTTWCSFYPFHQPSWQTPPQDKNGSNLSRD